VREKGILGEWYVQEAERTLHKLESSMKQVETLRVQLAAYYCEDESTFLLDDAFKVIRAFCDKLQKAIKVYSAINHRETINLTINSTLVRCIGPKACNNWDRGITGVTSVFSNLG